MGNKLRKDDPVYYKCALQGLIAEAKENGLKIGYIIDSSVDGVTQIRVVFTNDIGEIAGANVYEKEVEE